MKKKVELIGGSIVYLEISPKLKLSAESSYPIGAYVENHGWVYLVCKGIKCFGCGMYDYADGQCLDWNCDLGDCQRYARPDKQSIIFRFVGYIV